MELAALLEQHDQRVAVVDGDRRLTFQALVDEAARVASGLTRLGLQRGDVLAVWLPTVAEWLSLLVGAAHLGVLVVPLNTRYRAVEVRNVLRSARPRVLVMPSRFLDIDFRAILAEATAELLGWMRPQGGFVFSARLKDTLRLRGYLVDPAEIEEYLVQHPAVAAAQVVGVERPGEGDVAVAFVLLAPGQATSEAVLVNHCGRGLAAYKVPRRIAFLDEFPTVDGPNGVKIQKTRLRELAAQQV